MDPITLTELYTLLTALYNLVAGQLAGTAQKNWQDQVLAEVQFTSVRVAQLEAQMLDVLTQLDIVETNQGNDLTILQSALAQPVTLPPAPPGYGGPSTDDNASAVWNYILRTSGIRAGDALAIAGNFPLNMTDGYIALPAADVPYVVSYINWESHYGVYGASRLTSANPHDILPTDATILDFLNRVDGPGAWTMGDNGYPYMDGLETSGGQRLQYTMGPADFAYFKGAAAAKAAAAPVWPGLANVTLGTEVPLTDGLVVIEPMDGVIVRITSAPPGKNYVTYGARQAYRFTGALAFSDDAGAIDTFYPLAFDTQVFCPTRMTRAAAVMIHLAGGVVGTLQPWVIS